MALLEVRNITVTFGGVVAVNDVSFDAEGGRITGLIGPNGAGKTTLFNVITGLQRAVRGQVLLDGAEISNLAPYQRARRGMARTFQRLELFGTLTVRENVEVAASIARRWVREPDAPGLVAERLIERVGLTAVADVRADALPTGQGRLVELARSLATQPRLLLLDEPASGQSTTETEHFADVLRDLSAGGMAVVLVEHDMTLVMNVCEYIHVLDFGSTLAAGNPEQVRADPAVLAAYLGSEWQTGAIA
ncbi:MAG TPA: ABC transporter ATP-binding protein [Acidimicrobiales bacterium]|nr:ABC transporter ATP-binding protein [Acidimicrobiales bacterium]